MSSLHKKSLIATAAIFCCRFTGLLREVVYTGLFGATGALDAFLTAFRVPNMLRDMFAEGALSQSFTSVMSKVEKQDGPGAAWQLANQVVAQLVSLMVCIVALGVLLSGFFMQQLYPERATLVFEYKDSAAAPLVVAEGTYLGSVRQEDGRTQASFSLPAPLTDCPQTAVVRLSSLQNLPVGGTVKLSTQRMPDGLRVEQQDFMNLAADLCRIMWPFILLASLSALSMGALNVFGIFGLPNLASAAFNLTTVIVGCLVGWFIDPNFGRDALYGFAIAVVLGGAAQLLVQVPALRRKGYRPRWSLGLRLQAGKLLFTEPAARRVWLLMIPGVIAAGITQTNIFINTSFALYLPGGAVTALSGAFHLWQLPVALFGVAVGMVVLPSVSRMTLDEGQGARRDIARHLAQAMRFVAFFAVPSAVILGIWGQEIVSIFFQRGRFDEHASALTGQVLSAYCLGLLGYAGMKVLQPVFLALEKPWAPAGLALISATISVVLNYCFVHVFQFKEAAWLALTTSVVTTLNFLFYFFYLRHLLGTMATRHLIPGLLRIIAAGTVLGVICWQIRGLFFTDFLAWDFLPRLGTLAVAGAVVGGIYLAACFLFRVPELEAFSNRFLKRRARR
ncbi:MAG: murein biosynthesis integral membrane protein MurJ [Akkermansia sp.]|nr:murein biosynthesis integral membrane protein MurJ [Akkermansia sp.]